MGSWPFERVETQRSWFLFTPHITAETWEWRRFLCWQEENRTREQHPPTWDPMSRLYPACFPNPACSPHPACSHILLLPALFLMPVARAGMGASTGWCLTASLTVLSQNLECCKHRSASPCFQHSCEQRSLGSLFFIFIRNQRNLLQILPSQNSTMTFFTAWRGSLKLWSLFPLPVTGHRAGWHLSVKIPPPWMVLTWWHRAGAAMAGVVLPGQWQAWELCTATPCSRQTLRGKANWDYLTNCLTNQHLFLRGGKWEWVNTPNSFKTKWLLTFRQTSIIVSWFPPGSNLPSPLSAKDNFHSCLKRGYNLLEKLHLWLCCPWNGHGFAVTSPPHATLWRELCSE